jgi:membrane protease YdiL (CAAX protease family)
MHGRPQPGWYPDPWAQSWYRWWNGDAWTPSIHPTQVVVAEPRPPHVSATFHPIAAPIILVATFVSILLTTAVIDNIDIAADWIVIVIAYTVLFGLMTAASLGCSFAFGTRSLRRDFGFSIKVDDIGWGALAFVGGTIARMILVLLLSTQTEDPVRDPGRTLETDRGAAFIAFSIAAVVGAPLIEELVFRGVLLRALTKLAGAPIAIGLQAVLFAAYHFVPDGGGYSHFYFGALVILGAAAGIAVERTGRLGPGIVLHFMNNALAMLILGAS